MVSKLTISVSTKRGDDLIFLKIDINKVNKNQVRCGYLLNFKETHIMFRVQSDFCHIYVTFGFNSNQISLIGICFIQIKNKCL